MRNKYAYVGIVSFLCLILLRPFLEATPTRHMLILLPSLALSGALIVHGLLGNKLKLDEASANGLTLLGVSMILFWMLPRYIDKSLINPLVEIFKFISIPAFVGGVLALAWRKTNPFLRGFLQANALSMLGVFAFLYTHAPVRICNSYLVSDQYALGINFLWVTLGLTLYWTVPLFFTPKEFDSHLDMNSECSIMETTPLTTS